MWVPHKGHGKEVDLGSTKGTPEELQTLALLTILFSRCDIHRVYEHIGLHFALCNLNPFAEFTSSSLISDK